MKDKLWRELRSAAARPPRRKSEESVHWQDARVLAALGLWIAHAWSAPTPRPRTSPLDGVAIESEPNTRQKKRGRERNAGAFSEIFSTCNSCASLFGGSSTQ